MKTHSCKGLSRTPLRNDLKMKGHVFLVTHSSSMASTLASFPIPSVSYLFYSWRYKSSDWCNTFENCFFQRTVITPMIEVFGGKAAYSNFWGGMDEDVSHKEREAHAYVFFLLCFSWCLSSSSLRKWDSMIVHVESISFH